VQYKSVGGAGEAKSVSGISRTRTNCARCIRQASLATNPQCSGGAFIARGIETSETNAPNPLRLTLAVIGKESGALGSSKRARLNPCFPDARNAAPRRPQILEIIVKLYPAATLPNDFTHTPLLD
jgi:hypothetical protein